MKIVMACGGSGGHIFPAISVAEEIQQRDPSAQVFFACGKKEIEETIFGGIPKKNVVEIDSAAFQGGRALFGAGIFAAGFRNGCHDRHGGVYSFFCGGISDPLSIGESGLRGAGAALCDAFEAIPSQTAFSFF